MGKQTSDYASGIEAFSAFCDMLFLAMRRATKGIRLSRSGAFYWREYRIDSYEDLATGQYFCGLYLGRGFEPSRWERFDRDDEIFFAEVYLEGSRYNYPWESRLRLSDHLFYELSATEQRSFLEGWVAGIAHEARVWQRSRRRRRKVPHEFLNGGPVQENPVPKEPPLRRVAFNPIEGIKAQNQLFSRLAQVLREVVPERDSRSATVRPNDSWRNWDFRGLRLKVNEKDGKPKKGSFPFSWRIRYDRPCELAFLPVKGIGDTLKLDEVQFFDCASRRQSELLREFVEAGLSAQE